LRDVVGKARDAEDEVEGLRRTAERASSLEVECTALRDAVSRLSEEAKALRSSVVRSTRDERRVVRLERALVAYGRVESAFAARTGQGFFGVTGLAFAMGIDLRGVLGEAAAARATKSHVPRASSLDDEASEGDLARALSSIDAGARGKDLFLTSATPGVAVQGVSANQPFDPNPFANAGTGSSVLEGYLQRVAASFGAEARAEAAAEFSSEREALLTRIRDCEVRCSAGEVECARAWKEVEVLRRWKGKCESVEEEVGKLLLGFKRGEKGFCGIETGVQDGAESSALAGLLPLNSPILSTPWDLSINLSSALPKIANVCGLLRATALSSCRRLRLAEGEASDLREELAMISGEGAQAMVLSAAHAHGEIVKTIREGKAAREELKAEVLALTSALGVAEDRIQAGEVALEDCKLKLEENRGKLAASETERRAEVDARLKAESSVSTAKREAALHETRWREASDLNDRALALLGEKDAILNKALLECSAIKTAATRLGERAVNAGVIQREELMWLRPRESEDGTCFPPGRPIGDSPLRNYKHDSGSTELQLKDGNQSVAEFLPGSKGGFELEESLSNDHKMVSGRGVGVETRTNTKDSTSSRGYAHLAATKHPFYSENLRSIQLSTGTQGGTKTRGSTDYLNASTKGALAGRKNVGVAISDAPQLRALSNPPPTKFFVSPSSPPLLTSTATGRKSQARDMKGAMGEVSITVPQASISLSNPNEEEGLESKNGNINSSSGKDDINSSSLLSISFETEETPSPSNNNFTLEEDLEVPSPTASSSFRGRFNSSVLNSTSAPPSAHSSLETVLTALVANATEFAKRISLKSGGEGVSGNKMGTSFAPDAAASNDKISSSTELSILLARSSLPTTQCPSPQPIAALAPSSSPSQISLKVQQTQPPSFTLPFIFPVSPQSSASSVANSQHSAITRRSEVLLHGTGGGNLAGALQRTLAMRQKEAKRSLKVSGRERR